MSIELMERALEFITGVYFGEHEGSRADREKLEADLTTAVQQAEAKQPATGEPVAQWQKRHPIRTAGRWISTDEHDAKWWSDHSRGWEARPLYTHPAPGVPDAVVRDAELLNELETLVKSKGTHGLSFDYCKHVEDGYVMEKGFRMMWRHHLGERKPTLREAIDAAMLTAAQAQKGQS